MLKKTWIVLAFALVLVLACSAPAFASFGPHGGYVDDTDACAGCHRAHTSFTSVGWTDKFGFEHASALLVSNASTMEQFCNACHGDYAPGASTNVVSGIFDSGPSGASGETTSMVSGENAVTLGGTTGISYLTNSTFNAALNGGGFTRMPTVATPTLATDFKAATSRHDMQVTGPLWGYGNAVQTSATAMTCTSCHDPHGSANYRLLKDALPSSAGGFTDLGGYNAAGEPEPYVISAEQGYPTGGWRKHEDGAADMVNYRPNYTSAEYALANTAAGLKGISAWCAGCHEVYNAGSAASSSSYDYGAVLPGAKDYHRHAVNVTLLPGDLANNPAAYLNSQITIDKSIPLEMRPGGDSAAFRAGNWEFNDYLGCLTCHRAHGTSVDMTGWAEAQMTTNTAGYFVPVRSVQPTTSGVEPANSSALLRAPDRGVCERCHNK